MSIAMKDMWVAVGLGAFIWVVLFVLKYDGAALVWLPILTAVVSFGADSMRHHGVPRDTIELTPPTSRR